MCCTTSVGHGLGEEKHPPVPRPSNFGFSDSVNHENSRCTVAIVDVVLPTENPNGFKPMRQLKAFPIFSIEVAPKIAI
jgi:hypothetical protein